MDPYEAQRLLRTQQATPAGHERYAHGSGVEGAIAQATRRSDLHQARHRGLPETHPPHVLTALALNLVRVDAWLHPYPTWRQLGFPPDRLQPACHSCEFTSRAAAGLPA